MTEPRAAVPDVPETESALATAQANHTISNESIVRLALEGWLQSRMEMDRSLLQLAGGGIGLIVTLLTTVGVNSIVQRIAAFGSALAFAIVILVTLWIFHRNADYCIRVAKGGTNDDVWLTWMDRGAIFSFLVGIVLAIILGMTINGGHDVPQGHTVKESTSAAQEEKQIRSLNGLGGLLQKPVTYPTKPQPQPADASTASSPLQSTSKKP